MVVKKNKFYFLNKPKKYSKIVNEEKDISIKIDNEKNLDNEKPPKKKNNLYKYSFDVCLFLLFLNKVYFYYLFYLKATDEIQDFVIPNFVYYIFIITELSVCFIYIFLIKNISDVYSIYFIFSTTFTFFCILILFFIIYYKYKFNILYTSAIDLK